MVLPGRLIFEGINLFMRRKCWGWAALRVSIGETGHERQNCNDLQRAGLITLGDSASSPLLLLPILTVSVVSRKRAWWYY
jgi:hypothetical protein